MPTLILGIDDAGRGPVIGPMVLAGCLIDKKLEKELKELGVKDSKDLTPKRREFLAKKIKEKVEVFETSIIQPDDIDKSLNGGTNLNSVESIMCAKIINKINKTKSKDNKGQKIKVIVDCPSVSIEKWKGELKTRIKDLSNLEVVCEHKADRNYISVSAASIIAKSLREKEMDILKKKYGEEIGSGYPSDPSTCKFLDKYAEKHKKKGIFRQTWKTWKNACIKLEQKKLL